MTCDGIDRILRSPGKRTLVHECELSIVGQGKWAATKHGVKGKGGWKKLHFGVDGSSAIVTQETEALLGCNILNRVAELGMPVSVSIGP